MEGKRILLVEDSVFLSEVYANVLRESGADVTVVHTGEEGHEKANQGGWDLMIIDVVLPGIDGFEIVNRLKQQPPQMQNGPVVFLTSLDSENEIEKAKELQCEYVLKSDINPGLLVEKVSSYFSGPGSSSSS